MTREADAAGGWAADSPAPNPFGEHKVVAKPATVNFTGNLACGKHPEKAGPRADRGPRRPKLVLFGRVVEDAAADLVFLDRFEQSLEVAFAKAFVALALDKLEEDRPDHCF